MNQFEFLHKLIKCTDIAEDYVMIDIENSDITQFNLHISDEQKSTAETVMDDYFENKHCKIKHALLLSICISDYKNTLPYKHESDIDSKNIQNIFGENGYGYSIICNAQKYVDIQSIRHLFVAAKDEIYNHNDKYDAFICIISAYGIYTHDKIYPLHLYLSDNNMLSIMDILNQFNNDTTGLEKAFIQKPKIFIIQTSCFNKKVIKNDGICDKDITIHLPNDEMFVLLSDIETSSGSYDKKKTGSPLIYLITKELSVKNNNNEPVSFMKTVDHIKHKANLLSLKPIHEISTLTNDISM